MDDLTLISAGHPTIGEIRARAMVDFKRARRQFEGDVELHCHAIVRNRRYLSGPLFYVDKVEAVVRAAVSVGVIVNREAITAYHFHAPTVGGLDCMYVSFRPVSDRSLLLV